MPWKTATALPQIKFATHFNYDVRVNNLTHCYILRDYSNNVFTVEIPKAKNVAILKKLIKEENAHLLAHVDAKDLDLFQVR